jgi:hypothetical protein
MPCFHLADRAVQTAQVRSGALVCGDAAERIQGCRECLGVSLAHKSSQTMTPALEEMYRKKLTEPSDINEHLPTLKQYASQCQHVTEFGVRTMVSTWGLLAGTPAKMVSYDLTHSGQIIDDAVKVAKENGTDYTFIVGNSREVQIEPTDLLFIDTFHVYSQLTIELNRHANKAGRFIIMHDTETFGERGEAHNEPGLLYAIRDFLNRDRTWRIKEQFYNNNGLTILHKCSAPE